MGLVLVESGLHFPKRYYGRWRHGWSFLSASSTIGYMEGSPSILVELNSDELMVTLNRKVFVTCYYYLIPKGVIHLDEGNFSI